MIYKIDAAAFTRRNVIIERLQKKGYKITKQRLLIIDILLTEQCSSCKEIYYKASLIDSQIGAATVYRILNMLVETKIIERLDTYRFMNLSNALEDHKCQLIMQDESEMKLTNAQIKSILKAGLAAYGYSTHQKVAKIKINESEIVLG